MLYNTTGYVKMPDQLITLYSYPQMFGLPDNNPFGLKVDTFFRLAKINFRQQHILDPKDAPRGQLPYINDNGLIISDSNMIIQYLSDKYNIDMDNDLTSMQKNISFLITRMLDSHLYWIMSYSRWQDEEYWPFFRAEIMKSSGITSDELLNKAKKYNIEKYKYQGIGRYNSEAIYQFGLDDLKVINSILGDNKYILGNKVCSLDASCYGYLANIFYFAINTPLKAYIENESSLHSYIDRVRQLLDY